MSVRTHYIVIGNQRHGYTLHPAQKVTTLICRSANIEARFPNDEIPRILAELPHIIIKQHHMPVSAPQSEVLRFRVTEDEKEQILHNAQEAGYTSVSAYIRDIALQRSNEELSDED